MAEISGGGMDTATVQALIAAAVPQPANTPPPSVSDSGALGTSPKFALADHTHASKARKAITAPVSTSTYTWTYPTAFATGVVPIISCIAQTGTGNTDLYNVQIMGAPTNTSCVFQINRVSAGLLSLLLGALSINPTPGSITLHMLALEP
jgi:hypothetical protein